MPDKRMYQHTIKKKQYSFEGKISNFKEPTSKVIYKKWNLVIGEQFPNGRI